MTKEELRRLLLIEAEREASTGGRWQIPARPAPQPQRPSMAPPIGGAEEAVAPIPQPAIPQIAQLLKTPQMPVSPVVEALKGRQAPQVPQMAPSNPQFSFGAPSAPAIPQPAMAAPSAPPSIPAMPGEEMPPMPGTAAPEPVFAAPGDDAMTFERREDIQRWTELGKQAEALYDWNTGQLKPGAEAQMQALQSEMQAIRQKYGGDPRGQLDVRAKGGV